MISKEILIQYCDLKEEIREIRKRIIKVQKQLDKMEDDGYSVSDSVKGGAGGKQNYKITGFPYPEYSRKKTLLSLRKAKLDDMEIELLEKTRQVEEYISGVDDSKMRRMLSMRFVDNLSFEQIGLQMGYDRTSISKKIDKFMSI